MSETIRLEAEAKYPVLTTAGRDHKAWAKRIVYRNERGAKDLKNCQIQCAYPALEMPIPSSAE